MGETDGIDLLLVEDDPEDANYIERMLVEFGRAEGRPVTIGEVQRSDRLADALESVTADPDVVLLDLNLPDSRGIKTVEAITDRAPDVPVVVITGTRDTDLGPEAIKRGAQDYLRKGRITDELLYRTVRYAIDRHEKQREIVTLNRRLALLNRIVGQDIRADLNLVVGRGDELRNRVDQTQLSLVDSLLKAASNAADRTNTAAELLSLLSTDDDPYLDAIDVGPIVEEQVSQTRDSHDVTLTVERTTPESELVVETSPLLRSALEQLLSNAVRHSDHETPQVVVTLDSTPQSVTVTIADDGVGMSDTQKRLLNDPDRRYHEQSGIGTGLFLVTTILEQSGGAIKFADNEPHGTVVTVELPRANTNQD